MEIRPPAPLALARTASPRPEAKERDDAAKAGSDFEALLVTRLLKSARAARLGDDLMGGSDQIRDLIDEERGRLIARSAPLGLAQLLARETPR